MVASAVKNIAWQRVAAALGMGALFVVILCLTVRAPVAEAIDTAWYRCTSYHGIVVGLIASSLVCILSGNRGTAGLSTSHWVGALAGASLVLGVVLSLLGLSLVRTVSDPLLVHVGYCLLFGLLQGLGLGGLLSRWAQALPREGFVPLVRSIAAAMLAGVPMWLLVCVVADEVWAHSLIALLVAVSTACLFVFDVPAVQQVAEEKGAGLWKSFCARMWVPIAGLALCAFISGLTFDKLASQVATNNAMLLLLYGVGSVLGLIALLIAVRKPEGDRETEQLLGNVALPLALTVVMVTPILQVMVNIGEPFNTMCGALSVVGFAVLTAVSCAVLLEAADIQGLGRPQAVSVVLVACAASAELGMVSIGFLGVGGRAVCMVIEAAIIAALAIWFARGKSFVGEDARPAQQLVSEMEPPAAASTFEEVCSELSERYMLSPREREVLELLGHGHGSGYIAEALGISENTARTHTRHIYEKLGVNSREDLIDLFR